MAANDLIQVLAAKLFGLPVLSATHEGRDAVRPKRAETTLQNYNFSMNPQGDVTKNYLFYKNLDLVPFWNQFDWKGKDLGRKLFAHNSIPTHVRHQPNKTMDSKLSFFLFFSFFIHIFPIFAPAFRPKKRKTRHIAE